MEVATQPPSMSFDLQGFHPIFRRALELETHPALLEFRAGPIPYWGLIRLALLIRLLDRVQGENSARDIYLKPRPVKLARSFAYVAHSFWRSPFQYADKDILFFCSGVNRIRQNGAYFNSRVDYFVRCVAGKRTLLIEGADDLRYSWPRSVAPVSFRGALTAPAALWARVGHLDQRAQRNVRDFMALLADAFEGVLDEQDCSLLAGYLTNSILRSKAYYRASLRLLDRLRPRIAFLENAHSGFDIEFLVAARERGVLTAEYQHGAINPYSPYHNFHPHLLANGYADFLPDYFLSYGDFWNRLLTTSAEIVSVGNPHVETMRSQLPSRTAVPGSVYFLSSANAAEKYMAHMRDMLREGFTVVFRPHPVERPLLAQRYGSFFDDMKVTVDVSNDFYGQLRGHEFVVGDGRSTSLFEAGALVPGRVFIIDSGEGSGDVLPNHEFLPTIRSPRELRQYGLEGDSRTAVETLFAPDWENRFKRFVERVLSH